MIGIVKMHNQVTGTTKHVRVLPEVSLITSWYVANADTEDDTTKLLSNVPPSAPPGISKALNEGISLLDLYFLTHQEIGLYAQIAGIEDDATEPQAFLASLEPTHIVRIADHLRAELVKNHRGSGVGRRPRFAALATFFPGISVPRTEDPSDRTRQNAVKALRATLYLAHLLGCRVVEAVAGAGVPNPGSDIYMPADRYRALRLQTLAMSLNDVYSTESSKERIYGPNPLMNVPDPPVIALELEPGVSFLLQDVEAFLAVRERLTDNVICERIRLNADLAHFFILGYHKPEDLGEARDLVTHMHISDHAGDSRWGGAHFSDLPVGRFHFYEDYQPWLKEAIERTNKTRQVFSGFVAVELEANNSPEDVLASISLTRRWLQQTAGESKDHAEQEIPQNMEAPTDTHECALLVVDLGNSTSEILGPLKPEEGAWGLQKVIAALCKIIREEGGSVMSFTGDGFIALFETSQLKSETIRKAVETACKIPEMLRRSLAEVVDDIYRLRVEQWEHGVVNPIILPLISVRVGLHFGLATIPTRGMLSNEVIGKDVVMTTRVCDELKNAKKKPSVHVPSLIGMTEALHALLPEAKQSQWKKWKKVSPKGLNRTTLYLYVGPT